MFISSLSPQRNSDCRASRELFTAVDKERGGCLCSYLGTGLPVRWCLALLAGIPPTLPPRPFKVLKALGTRPGLVGSVWNLGSTVEEDGLPLTVEFLQVLMKSPHHLTQNPTVVPSGSLGPVQIHKGSPGWGLLLPELSCLCPTKRQGEIVRQWETTPAFGLSDSSLVPCIQASLVSF